MAKNNSCDGDGGQLLPLYVIATDRLAGTVVSVTTHAAPLYVWLRPENVIAAVAFVMSAVAVVMV